MDFHNYSGNVIIDSKETESTVTYKLEDGRTENCSKEYFEKMTTETRRRIAGGPYPFNSIGIGPVH